MDDPPCSPLILGSGFCDIDSRNFADNSWMKIDLGEPRTFYKKPQPQPDLVSTRRKSNAYGDSRPYSRTNVAEAPGLPQQDETDERIVLWCGKRLYLGGQGTQLARLFFFLAEIPGRWHPMREIEEYLYKQKTDERWADKKEIKKVQAKIRKLVSRLRDRIAEHLLDDHAIIVMHKRCYGMGGGDGYVLLLFQDQKYEEGQEPRIVSQGDPLEMSWSSAGPQAAAAEQGTTS